jgi:hypothetical protein
MANILTAGEAANFIRSTADDAIMLQYLPLVDEYLKNASGHDWAADSTKDPTAKTAAGMLLTFWYDNPGMVGQPPASLTALLVQLEGKALKWRKYCFNGGNGAGSLSLPGARTGDAIISVTGVYLSTGDQHTAFETTISVDDCIQQVSASNLTDHQYVAILKHPADDLSA